MADLDLDIFSAKYPDMPSRYAVDAISITVPHPARVEADLLIEVARLEAGGRHG